MLLAVKGIATKTSFEAYTYKKNEGCKHFLETLTYQDHFNNFLILIMQEHICKALIY